jgi:hypothetical protein
MPSEATDPSVASYPINLRFATPEIQTTGVGATFGRRGRKPFRARQSKQSPLFTATRFKESCGDRQGKQGQCHHIVFFRHLQCVSYPPAFGLAGVNLSISRDFFFAESSC